VKPLAFVGKLSSSKSMMNRALLAQSFNPYLKVNGDSECDDVVQMEAAIRALHSGEGIYAGAAGTVLRFMALRASRIPGRHILRGEKRLFQRPQQELLKILGQLSVQAQLTEDSLIIEGDGWKLQGDTLLVPAERSSQFATAVLLSSWELPFDLFVSRGQSKVSEGYWRMSVEMAKELGLHIDFWDGDFRVPKGQKIRAQELNMEIDMSSAFALSAVAAVSGRATLLDFPEKSLQPDSAFVSILSRMGVPIRQEGTKLLVEKAAKLNGVAVNLKSTPDLFPVLAALCALAEGESDLFGAPHLVHKESDRLGIMVEWLKQAGREVLVKEDGVVIRGEEPAKPKGTLHFDCEQDHRLAFAAAIFMAAGFAVEIKNRQVVDKSFPEFWSILGWNE
jgi:3-phosphoshikimate 1-carboxyvinyltransferase